MRQRRLISTGVASLLCGLAALATLALGAPKGPPAQTPNGPPSQVPPGNGQVEVTLSQTSDVLDLSNAVIGDYKTGTVTVSNGGKLAAEFGLTGDLDIPVTSPGAGALADQMRLYVSKTPASGATTQVYSGTLTGFNAAGSYPLGLIYPQQGPHQPKSVRLDFQLSFPSTGTDAGDNALQDLGPIDQRFVVDATQHAGASNGNGNGPPGSVPPAGGNGAGQAATPTGKSAETVIATVDPAPTKKSSKTKDAREIKAKRAAASGPLADDLRRNGLALGLLAVAAALLLTLTLPPRGRSQS